MICPKCRETKLISFSGYLNRKKRTMGGFCPVCFQMNFSEVFGKFREGLLKEISQSSKPKFGKWKHRELIKIRLPCNDCLKNKIINREKWKLRKMEVKKDETPRWEGTCQICEGVWTQDTSNEYQLVDPNQKNDSLGF